MMRENNASSVQIARDLTFNKGFVGNLKLAPYVLSLGTRLRFSRRNSAHTEEYVPV